MNIETEVRVSKELFYNEDGMWGVYGLYPLTNKDKIKTHPKYGNFVASGVTRRFKQGEKVKMLLKPYVHKKYGDSYEIISVEQEQLDTVEKQQAYLRTVVTDNQANILTQAYPNEMIIDLIEGDKIDVSKTKGIKEKTLSDIKQKVLTNKSLSILLVELKGFNITPQAVRKLLEHFKTPDILLSKIRQNIYNLTEVKRFGFKTVDKYALNRGDDPTSINRIVACFRYIIEQEANEGHAWVHIDDLFDKSVKILEINPEYIQKTINKLKNNKKFYYDGQQVSLKRYYSFENGIADNLRRIRDSFKPLDKEVHKIINEIEKQNGFKYTAEQRKAIELATKNGVVVLNGAAGSGKTSVVKGIIKAYGMENYATCALSGKASNILEQQGLESHTIHRLLKYDGKGFGYSKDNKLPYKTIVIDEGSMVNSYLFNLILSAVPDGSNIIIVGDNGQLPSIGFSDVFSCLLNSNDFARVELTQVHRQAAKSGILSTANKIRNGEQIISYGYAGRMRLGELKDMSIIAYKNRKPIHNDIIKVCKHYAKKVKLGEIDLKDFQVIVSNRDRGDNSVVNLNNSIQKLFIPEKQKGIKFGAYEFKVGDKVIQKGNSYEISSYNSIESYKIRDELISEDIIDNSFNEMELNMMGNYPQSKEAVFNGTLGEIVYVDKENRNLLVKYENIEKLIEIKSHELETIELAYAITVHRSQGSTIKHVLFAFDFTGYTLLSKQLVYTGITRASKSCLLMCEANAFYKAVQTDHSGERRTFLENMI